MPGSPFVSIITPSYNQGRFLEQTILSVLEQDYPDIEYIIIDGRSTDNSLEIIQHFADQLAYWESQPDHGQANAINKGLRRSQGEILGWLNSDDLLAPGAVRKVVQVFLNNPDVDVVYGRLERIDEQGRLIPTPRLPKDRIEFRKDLVINECLVNQPGSFWRRSIMDEVGLLNEELVYNLDYEYWIRLALQGANFMKLPDIVASFRLSSKSKTVQHTAAMAEEQLQILNDLLAQPDLAMKLELSNEELVRQSRTARSVISLHAFYGKAKERNWKHASKWLIYSLQNDPFAIFQTRWLMLAGTSLKRHLFVD